MSRAAPSPPDTNWRDELFRQLGALHAANVGKTGLPGAAVRLGCPAWPDGGIEWSAGIAREDSGAPMTPATPFHVASVGKAMTAVLILQLWEAGALPRGLDTPIVDFDQLGDVLAHIPVLTRREAPVTIRQMLLHASGLRDAFNDDAELTAAENGGRSAPGSLGVRLGRHPTAQTPGRRAWPAWDAVRAGDPEGGVLNWFIWGSGAARAAANPPGARFHYSDTAYMLLALLAERLAGASYERLLIDRIFAPLGLADTSLAYGEIGGAPGPHVSDFLYGGAPVFSRGLDVSWDWGGGGQISTGSDLDRFLRGLFAGRLFARPETLAEMTAFVALPQMPDGCTGLGLGVRRLATPAGVELWGHAGAWSVQAFYAPAFDVTITGAFNQPMRADPRLRTWVADVADLLPALAG